MTVEGIRRSNSEDESKNDLFPVGMRVLAVDDDQTCLMVLETLLRRCRYHVTTTTNAITALKMLRENRNKFDLVISDVQMPDMDGFRLLELIGLEMDLPVIMLSGNGDPRLVMKGVTHGACDYLLKPVRIEELKNIWQHVIRRKKSESKDQNNLDNQDKSQQGVAEDGQSPAVSGPTDRNGKHNRKRKEQNEEEDEEGDENGNENEDSSTQKKPRVVWSVELHRKFVAAVNQLGIDKAVPKKILDLMNVDRLTRENVASHLQKYRLYLKRLSCVASQQANMVAALGGKDPSYLRMGSLDGLGDFHAFSGSGQLANASLTSLPPGGMLGRLNSPAGFGVRGLTSSGMIQLGHNQSSSNSLNEFGKLQQVALPGSQHGNLLQGMPTTLELDQLQHNKCISRIGEFSTAETTVFPVSNDFTNNGITISSLNNSFINVPNNSMMLQGPRQQIQNRGAFGNQLPVRMPSHNSASFDIGVDTSHIADLGRCDDNWQSGVSVPFGGFSSNPLSSTDSFSHTALSSSNSRDNIKTIAPNVGSNPLNVSPQGIASTVILDSRRDIPCQTGPVNLQHESPKFSNFGSMSNSVPQNMNYTPKQKWEDHKHDYTQPQDANLIFSSLNSAMPIQGAAGPLGQTIGQSNSVSNRKMDVTLNAQSNCMTPYLMQHIGGEKTTLEATIKYNEDRFLDPTKSQDSCGSLEDMMSAMIRRERDDLTLLDGDIGCDVFSLGTCM